MKFIKIILIIIVVYFAIGGLLAIAKVCPEYSNRMPGIVSEEENKSRTFQTFFCPLSKKAY